MSYYANPTENKALGDINKEWNNLSRVAKRLRRRLEGTLTFPELYTACQRSAASTAPADEGHPGGWGP